MEVTASHTAEFLIFLHQDPTFSLTADAYFKDVRVASGCCREEWFFSAFIHDILVRVYSFPFSQGTCSMQREVQQPRSFSKIDMEAVLGWLKVFRKGCSQLSLC